MALLTDAWKELIESAKREGKTEVLAALLDAQANALALLEENSNLKAKVRELQSRLDERERLEWDRNKYWPVRSDGRRESAPLCARCCDGSDKRVRMVPCGGGDKGEPRWRCTVCLNTVPRETDTN